MLLPAEPPQVPLQAPGRDAPEPPEEPPQPLVQRVDHAELVLAGVGRAVAVARRRARLGERRGVRGVHVGGHLRARHARGRQPRADLLGAGAAARGQDRGAVAQVVDDGDDGDLQRRYAAGARPVPVRVRPPRHPRAPARERLVQVQLVGLRGHPVAAAHRLELRAHRLEDPHPHEPAGLDAHAAARGGARQALAGGHPLDVGRPGGGGELGEREHAPGRRRERPPAAAAQSALGAAGQRRQDRGLQVGDEPLHALDAQGPCPL